MKHIGKTNEHEVIVSLKIQDINELMGELNAAELYYFEKLSKNKHDRRAEQMRRDAGKWWNKLYELRETI